MVVKVKVGKAKVGKGRRGLGGANWGIVGDMINATFGNISRLGRAIDDLNPETKKKNIKKDEEKRKKGIYNAYEKMGFGPGGRRSAPKKSDPKKTKPVKNKKK